MNHQSPEAWDWQGIPKLHWLIVWYESFTTVYFIYVLIKNFAINQLDRTELLYYLGAKINQPLRCYLPGRFYVTTLDAVDVPAANICVLTHLIWRAIQWSHRQQMTLHNFLLLTRRDLKLYYSTVNMSTIHQNNNDTSARNTITKCFLNETLSYPLPQFLGEKKTIRSQFRLRPGRTQQANDRLRKWFSLTTLLSIMLVSFISSIIFPLIYLRLISEIHYKTKYDSCDLGPPWAAEINPAERKYSLYIRWYRFMFLLVDLVENLLLWIETGISAFMGMGLAALLNYDLMVYLYNIHDNVIQLTSFIVKMDPSKQIDTCDTPINWRPSESALNNRENSEDQTDDEFVDQELNKFGPFKVDESTLMQNNLDVMMHELQFQIHDFFRQIERYDTYMSDVLTLTLLIWFSILMTYIKVSVNGFAWLPELLVSYDIASQTNLKPGTSPYHLMIVFTPIILVTLISFALLVVHRRCMITYRYLCPLIATYQSHRKLTLITIMDYFVERRTCYSLFRMSPFQPITYLSIVGWSFSCFFILRSLLERPSISKQT